MKKKKIIIISIAVLLLVGGIGVYKYFNKKENLENENREKYDYYSDYYFNQKYLAKNSYFIKNNTGLKALFDENGKQLSDFIYETDCEAECFMNGAAFVKKDGKTGLINKDGKWTANLGEYEISHLQYNESLFLAEKNDTKYLINNQGKVIYTDKEDTITSYASNYYYVEKNNQFIFYGLDGNILVKLEKKDDNTPIVSYTIDGFTNETLVINYEGKVYFYNLNTGKEIINYSPKNKEDIAYYLVDRQYYDYNNDTYILAGYKDTELMSNIYIKGNKVEYEKDVEICEKAYYSYLGEAICENEEEVYFLNKNFLKDVDLNKAQYYDKANYIKEVEDSDNKKNVEVYNNNKKVKTIYCASIAFPGVVDSKTFFISLQDEETCSKDINKYQIIKANGEALFQENYYEIIYHFDGNNIAGVSDGEDSVYLIDKKGNKISDYYEEIWGFDKYYIADKDDYQYLLDTKGKELLKGNTLNPYLINGKKLLLDVYDNKTIVYDYDSLKKIFEVNKKLESQGHYLVSSDNKAFYSVDGDLLYAPQDVDTNVNEAKAVTVYVFRGEGCPHCEEALEFLSGLQEKYNYLKVVSYEVWKNEANSDFHDEVIKDLNLQVQTGVPLIIIGDDYYLYGFTSNKGEELENKIKEAYENDNYTDKVGELSKTTDLKIEPENI